MIGHFVTAVYDDVTPHKYINKRFLRSVDVRRENFFTEFPADILTRHNRKRTGEALTPALFHLCVEVL